MVPSSSTGPERQADLTRMSDKELPSSNRREECAHDKDNSVEKLQFLKRELPGVIAPPMNGNNEELRFHVDTNPPQLHTNKMQHGQHGFTARKTRKGKVTMAPRTPAKPNPDSASESHPTRGAHTTSAPRCQERLAHRETQTLARPQPGSSRLDSPTDRPASQDQRTHGKQPRSMR